MSMLNPGSPCSRSADNGLRETESRTLLSLPPAAPDPNVFATAAEVDQILRPAVAASARTDAIIAIVIATARFSVSMSSRACRCTGAYARFRYRRAVAQARTAAYFSQRRAGYVLTSARSARSAKRQSRRQVQTNPKTADPNVQGPAPLPIGLGGHFPPDISHSYRSTCSN